MSKSRFSEEQIIAIFKELDAGAPGTALARRHGVSKKTTDNWKKKYGGMEASDPRRLRQVEDENRHLKKIVADHALHRTALRDVFGRKKQSNPDWACQRISDILYLGKGYPANAQAVARVLKESGCELEHVPTTPRRDKPRRFEREKPCEM